MVCVCDGVCVCVMVCVYAALCLSVSMPLSVCPCQCLCLSVCVNASVCLSVCFDRALLACAAVGFIPSLECHQGVVIRNGFRKFESIKCPTEGAAREYLRSFSLEHYWDIVLSNAILASEES
jgi:hypothetical protein